MATSFVIPFALCLLISIGSSILSSVLVAQFAQSQLASVQESQRNSAKSQLQSATLYIETIMAFMRMTTEGNVRLLQYKKNQANASFFVNPATFCSDINETLMTAWFPNALSKNQAFWSYTALYPPNRTSGWSLAMAAQHFADYHKDGTVVQYIAMPEENGASNESWARRVTWDQKTMVPTIHGPPDYSFSSYSGLGNITGIDWFTAMYPWVSADNNAYWYFTHQTCVIVNGVTVVVQTMLDAIPWQGIFSQMAMATSNFLVVDSLMNVVVTTVPEEIARLANCSGVLSGAIDEDVTCIADPANNHPTPMISAMYNSMLEPSWTDLTLPCSTTTRYSYVTLLGMPFLGASVCSWDKDELRLVTLWFQPVVTLTSNGSGQVAAVAILALLPTVILVLISVVAILVPMANLGATMVALTFNLVEKDNEPMEVPVMNSAFSEMLVVMDNFRTLSGTVLTISKYIPKELVRRDLAEMLGLDMQEDDEDNDEGNLSINVSSVYSEDKSKSVRKPRASMSRDTISEKISQSSRNLLMSSSSGQVQPKTHGALDQRRVGIVVLNIANFHRNLSANIERLSRVVSIVEASTKKLKGVLDTFHGDHFSLSFNSMVPCSMYTRNAVMAYCDIAQQLAALKLHVYCGISFGNATVGLAGSDSCKKFCVFSPVVTQAHALTQACGREVADVSCLAPAICLRDVASEVFYFHTRSMRLPQAEWDLTPMVAILHRRDAGASDEWMYELEAKGKDDPFQATNAIAEGFFTRRDAAAAAAAVKALDAVIPNAEGGSPEVTARRELNILLGQKAPVKATS